MSATPIYLDHAATTPLDARVLDAMLPFLRENYGNAASRQHQLGREASAAVELARGELGLLLGADPREIVFTSGATEANNLALKGVARADAHAQLPRRIISARSEHHAVLDPLASLERDGFEVVYLAVDDQGHIDLDQLAAELQRGARLVSLMAANNETGVLHPLERIGPLCREHGALFHTDATQVIGKEALNVDAACIDLLSLSAHKFYGPKGVGALYLRRKRPRVRVVPLNEGGGHEHGRRSGTLNVPAIVGLGKAAALRADEATAERERLAALRDSFEERLTASVHGVQINGDRAQRLAGHSNVAVSGVDAESVLARFERVCASSSAACTSSQHGPSHVLRAMGLGAERVLGSIRFSLGAGTNEAQLAQALDEIERCVAAVREAGPDAACERH